MELKAYLNPLRKWWWLILAATLVATAASYLVTRQQPPIYQARTTLLVGAAMNNPNPNGSDFYLTTQLASTYADMAKRKRVQAETMDALQLAGLPQYNVRVVPNTQLIEIAVVDTNPKRAKLVADKLAERLIAQTPIASAGPSPTRQAFINNQLDDLRVKIQETQDEIAQKQADLAGMFSARQIADTQTQIQGLQQKLVTLQANYAALLANTERGAINTLSVIEDAEEPTAPIGPNKPATILLAAAIGCILAAAAAYLLEYLDDSLKNPEEVKRVLDLTTLGAVPVVSGNLDGNEILMTSNVNAGATEAYRVLRTNLQFAGVERPLHALLITSPSPAEGKSLTAANLAAALAQAGRRIILVDADLHRPRLHRIFRLRNNVGVTLALLEEQPDLDRLLQDTEIANLRVLTTGPLPPNPAELLGSARMHKLIAQMESCADLVIVDSPPATALADAAILATQTDGVLLVLDAGRTRREMAKRALNGLQQAGGHIVGCILNRMPTRGAGYYYYYEHYGSYYSSDNGKAATRQSRPEKRRARREKPSEAGN